MKVQEEILIFLEFYKRKGLSSNNRFGHKIFNNQNTHEKVKCFNSTKELKLRKLLILNWNIVNCAGLLNILLQIFKLKTSQRM